MKPTSDASTPASGRPTLEDLLRVKRAERPDADFWTDFERGLRQKQLAAMIEPRPWWLAPMLFARRHRAAFALVPAAAAAAAAFVAIQGSTTTVAPSGSLALASLPAEPAPSSVSALPAERSISSASFVVADATPAKSVIDAPASITKAPSEVVPAEISLGVVASAEAAAPEPAGASLASAPMAPALAESASTPVMVAARPFMPEVFSELDRVFTVLAAAGTMQVAGLFNSMGADGDDVAELESVAFEGLDERHARLLASAGAERFIQASSVDHAGTRERVVHSLADGEELYASVSRLGMRGDRLSLKF